MPAERRDEEDADERVVDPGDEEALRRVGAPLAVADHDVGLADERHEPLEIVEVELKIAVREEDVG